MKNFLLLLSSVLLISGIFFAFISTDLFEFLELLACSMVITLPLSLVLSVIVKGIINYKVTKKLIVFDFKSAWSYIGVSLAVIFLLLSASAFYDAYAVFAGWDMGPIQIQPEDYNPNGYYASIIKSLPSIVR